MRSLFFGILLCIISGTSAHGHPCSSARMPMLSELQAWPARDARLIEVYERVAAQSGLSPIPSLCEGVGLPSGSIPMALQKQNVIVFPSRRVASLTLAEIEGAVAHELAHFRIGNFGFAGNRRAYMESESHTDVVAALWVGPESVAAMLRVLVRLCTDQRQCSKKEMRAESDERLAMLAARFASLRTR